MSVPIRIQYQKKSELFHIHFQSVLIRICMYQLVELLKDIISRDESILELGFLHSLGRLHEYQLRKNIEYQLYFGRTYVLWNQIEMTCFLSQIWRKHPTLMQWLSSELEPILSKQKPEYTNFCAQGV